jgi:nickel-dependent lactate racemase
MTDRDHNEPTTVDVHLAYGTSGLTVSLPADRTTVVRPQPQEAAADQAATLREALRSPVKGPRLREIVKPGDTIAVSICDATRPQPREKMVRALLEELEGIADPTAFRLLVATGTHRANTHDELVQMLGEYADTMTVINHDARDTDSLEFCGTFGDNVPVWLNRHWTEADVKITTGFVEPHFFAGFSGGPKLVAPGLAGMETVLTLHDAKRIGSPKATWAICEGNPVHDDVRAIAIGTGVSFAFDVILNSEQEIVQAFTGELLAMHEKARDTVKQLSMQAVPEPFDIVVTTNSGFPLDQNLYQAVKGMSAAASIVKPGGLIISAAECRDGFPDHGEFREPLTKTDSATALLTTIEKRTKTVPDQWQLQVLGHVLAKARVGLYSDYLSDDEIASAHLIPIEDISEAVAQECAKIGPTARVCALPEGPQTIAYVAGS